MDQRDWEEYSRLKGIYEDQVVRHGNSEEDLQQAKTNFENFRAMLEQKYPGSTDEGSLLSN